MKGSWDGSMDEKIPHATGMIEMAPQTVEEKILIRKTVIEKEGLIVSVFDVLRRIPRRILMILKLNDLTRRANNLLLRAPVMIFSLQES
jgi:aarF domain-containing kinase